MKLGSEAKLDLAAHRLPRLDAILLAPQMAVRFNGHVYLFELKVVEIAGEGAAMAQLKERRYADKFRGAGEPIHLVAVEFSRDTRNVVAFEVEPG